MSSFNLETMKTRDEVIELLRKAKPICDEFQAITDAYIADFYVCELWKLVPKEWAQYLEGISFPTLAAIMDTNNENLHPDMPDSLRTTLHLLRTLTLSREASQTLDNDRTYALPLYQEMLNPASALSRNFFRGVKFKKMHELTVMSKMVYKSFLQRPVDVVVDVGGGIGHLARMLTHVYNMRVVSIECNQGYTLKAREREKKTRDLLLKKYPELAHNMNHHPVYVNKRIEFGTSVNEFEKLIQESLGEDSVKLTYSIIGLHSCGNLAPTLLRLYKNSSNCKFINLASCCYFKMTTSEDNDNEDLEKYGYPMTKVPGLDMQLSYNARELACHSIETYLTRLTEDSDHLRVHAYRAALEKLIVDADPRMAHSQIRSTKYKPEMTFAEYVQHTTKDCDINVNASSINSEHLRELLEGWRKVVIFYTIRLMFAPVLETIILLDRYLFVKQVSECSKVTAVFRKDISPRAHLLIAMK